MRRWSVVCGVLFGLHVASLQPAWAQAPIPGDVGTIECAQAQLAIQTLIGNETTPPYKNHGQYVKAAADAANTALQSGQITGACHGCIVSQFARSIPIAEQTACGPVQCAAPGAPGWGNMVKTGGNATQVTAANAQACCLACVNNPDCAQWAFLSGSTCSLNVPPSTCVAPTFTFFNNSGNIRCP